MNWIDIENMVVYKYKNNEKDVVKKIFIDHNLNPSDIKLYGGMTFLQYILNEKDVKMFKFLINLQQTKLFKEDIPYVERLFYKSCITFDDMIDIVKTNKIDFSKFYYFSDTIEDEKWTILHDLCDSIYTNEHIKFLLKNNIIDVNIKTLNQNLTPLHFLCAKFADIFCFTDDTEQEKIQKLSEKASILLSYGADINSKDIFGNTPMHYLAQCGLSNHGDKILPVLQTLIEKGNPDLKIKNKKGNTFIHNMAYYINTNLNVKYYNVINYLIDKNVVDFTARNKEGYNFIEIICSEGRYDIADIIKQRKPELFKHVKIENILNRLYEIEKHNIEYENKIADLIDKTIAYFQPLTDKNYINFEQIKYDKLKIELLNKYKNNCKSKVFLTEQKQSIFDKIKNAIKK